MEVLLTAHSTGGTAQAVSNEEESKRLTRPQWVSEGIVWVSAGVLGSDMQRESEWD